jgi:hypothetical protein
MKYDDFIQLDESGQLQTVSREGRFLGERNDGKTRIALYELDQFYVQLVYKLKNGEFTGINVFKEKSPKKISQYK